MPAPPPGNAALFGGVPRPPSRYSGQRGGRGDAREHGPRDARSVSPRIVHAEGHAPPGAHTHRGADFRQRKYAPPAARQQVTSAR